MWILIIFNADQPRTARNTHVGKVEFVTCCDRRPHTGKTLGFSEVEVVNVDICITGDMSEF